MAVAALFITGRMVAEAVAPHWLRVNAGPLGYPPQWLAWHTPVVATVVRSRGLADVCHVLADVGQPAAAD
ncbi:hypothetical protein Q8G50_32740, partial [Klebsiella pneumoniae]